MPIDPFSSRSDPAGYYSFNSFEQRLHILQRLVQGQDFLILVVGEPGSGKTILLNRFLETSDKNWRTCKIRTHLTPPSPQGPASDSLNHHPAYILDENQIPIVMFDDAHRLTETELRYLLRDALTPGGGRIGTRLVLFGEPQILKTMENVSKAISSKTAINKIFMPTTTRSETAAYLWHRLSTAGFRGKNPFNSEIVRKIHRVSGGLPGRINEEAQKHLQQIQSPGNSFFSIFQTRVFKSKRLWIGIGSGLVAIALALWFTRPDSTRLAGRTALPDTSESAWIIKKKIKKVAPSPARIGRADKSGPKPKSSLKTAPPASTKKQNTGLKSAPKPAKNQPDVAIIYKDDSKTSPSRKSVQKGVHREKWLLRQNPSFYTIQIMGGRNETALRNYVQTHRDRYRGPLAYYQTKHKGGPWYPLLYGIYATRKQALAAKRALPEDIQKLSPWIRKISAVQKAIEESN